MLYAHNQGTHDLIVEAFQKHNNLCLVQGMGVGKSYIFMALASGLFGGRRILYIVPKFAVAENLKRYEEFSEIEERVDFTTFNAFNSQEFVEEMFNKYDVFVVDEAHHLGSPRYGKNVQKLLELVKGTEDKYFFAMTATPDRDCDGLDVSSLFDVRIDGLSTLDAIEAGLMPQLEYLACGWDISEEERKLYREKLDIENSKELLREILKDNPKNRWMVYFVDIQDMNDRMPVIKELFDGYRIIRIASDQKDSQDQINGIGENEKVVIVSVDMLLEGIHLPDMQGVLLFRNVQSLTVFTQIFGRITSIGATDSPLFVDCTNTAYRMFLKLLKYHGKGGAFNQKGNVREIIKVSLTNKKYVEIAQLLELMRSSSKPIDFDGKHYESIAEACRALGLDYNKVLKRSFRHGICAEDAMRYYLEKKHLFCFEGVYYDNMLHACKELGIPYRKAYRYYSEHKEEGCTRQEALQAVRELEKGTFFFRGERYKDVAACCEAFGLNANNVRGYAQRKDCDSQTAIEHYLKNGQPKRTKVTVFRGVSYSSQAECAKAFGIDRGGVNTIRVYARSHGIEWTEALEEFLQREPLTADGVSYRTVTEAAKKLGLSALRIRKEMDRGETFEEAVHTVRDMPSKHAFFFRGELFPTFKSACEHYGFSVGKVSSYMGKHNVSREDALAYYIEGANTFTFRGKVYSSAKECCDVFDVSYSAYLHYIDRHDVSKQEAIETLMSDGYEHSHYALTVNGESFKSAKEACQHFGLPYGRMAGRMQRMLKADPQLSRKECWEKVLADAIV